MSPAGKASPSIAELLAERIARDGPVGFDEFMDAALYHPGEGFYMRGDLVSEHFFTSVSVHPVFAEMLARHLDDVWTALGRPNPFFVVEIGAGDGALASRILKLGPEHPWGDALEYIGVEKSPARLAPAAGAGRARLVEDLTDAGRFPTAAIISNEFFDAIPFKIARRAESGWIEERVGLERGRPAFVDAPAGEDVVEYASAYARGAQIGARIEVRTGLDSLYRTVAELAPRLTMTSIDYGGPAEETHGPRLAGGTALAFRRHKASEDLLGEPGRRDLTAHVNFTQLRDLGRRIGLRALGPIRQSDFLAALGIGEYLVHLQGLPEMTVERYAKEREAVFQLVSPEDLGRFRVLLQYRGVRFPAVRGFGPS